MRILSAIILLLFINSCSGRSNEPITTNPEVFRYTNFGPLDMQNLSGPAPFVLGYEFKVGVNSHDSLKPIPAIVVVNFGDSADWIDVTRKLVPLESSLRIVSEHIYTEPGTYIIQARTTYWDGQVITNTFPGPIEVLPPDEGDGA